jgi:hypothetical protein
MLVMPEQFKHPQAQPANSSYKRVKFTRWLNRLVTFLIGTLIMANFFLSADCSLIVHTPSDEQGN